MTPFAQLRSELETYFTPEQIHAVEKAYQFAANAHQGQKRQSGEDYITHPIAAARILAGMHMDYQTIIAALLHDVLEDTFVEKSLLIKEFGEQVAELVDGVSKLKQIHFESKAEAQAENFRKMLLAMAKDVRVILIKLADRLHNMRTLDVLPPYKRKRIAIETLEIYAPIANRLGMHKLWIKFEDLGFQALYPLRYRILKESVQKARGNRKEIMDKIADELINKLEKNHINVYTVKGREKHLYSIYKKMRAKKIPLSEIMDVYAFRIIVDNIDSAYRTLGVVHQLYKPIFERFKDYIAIPKINNYRSLHTTLFGPYGVPIEIQIRTREMNREAENGIAAHWLYKSEHLSPDEAQIKARNLLKGLFELQESTRSPLEFIENVKINLFPEEVYVFTPKGDIKELPSGATAVDFAYFVHSDIGDSCIAAKINRRLAPLSTVLTNGQTVEIITAPGARPNPTWLNFVMTSKARSKIKHYLKEQRRTESKELGHQLLEKALTLFNININDVTDEHFHQVLDQLKYKHRSDLYEAIGLGHQLPIAVARSLSESETHLTTGVADKKATQGKHTLHIKGSQGMVVRFSECCRPIPGDPIIGVFNAGKGLIIHTQQCRHIAKLYMNPDKCVEVDWEEKVAGEFKVDVTIETLNQRGVLAQLTNVIADLDSNIENIRIESPESRFNIIKLVITVKNRVHLAHIMRRIRAFPTVTKLTRNK